MSDPTQQQRQPTEEELRAYLEQLRAADVAGVIAQVYEMLGTTAEVKLGRADARVLIDSMTAVVDAAVSSLPEELAQRMREGVAQLKTAQVQAEREGAAEQPQEASEAETPAGEAQPGGAQQPQDGQDQRMTDRLWIPGREQAPPPG